MKEIYEWLYDHYAEPVLNEKPLFQDQVLEEALSAAPEDLRLRLFDQVAGLHLRWCTEAFARGVQLELALEAEEGRVPDYRSR